MRHYEQLYANKLNNLEEMDKVLETYNLPRLNYGEIESLNRPIMSKEKSGTRYLHWWILPNILKRMNANPCQTFPKHWRGENTSKLISWHEHYPDARVKDTTKKENYRSPSLMKTDAKILNQMLANHIQQHTERVISQDQVGFISGKQKWFNTCKLVKVIHYIDWMKDNK